MQTFLCILLSNTKILLKTSTAIFQHYSKETTINIQDLFAKYKLIIDDCLRFLVRLFMDEIPEKFMVAFKSINDSIFCPDTKTVLTGGVGV